MNRQSNRYHGTKRYQSVPVVPRAGSTNGTTPLKGWYLVLPRPSLALLAALVAFVLLRNAKGYGKHDGKVPRNVARAMQLAALFGFLVV